MSCSWFFVFFFCFEISLVVLSKSEACLPQQSLLSSLGYGGNPTALPSALPPVAMSGIRECCGLGDTLSSVTVLEGWCQWHSPGQLYLMSCVWPVWVWPVWGGECAVSWAQASCCWWVEFELFEMKSELSPDQLSLISCVWDGECAEWVEPRPDVADELCLTFEFHLF